MKKVWDWLLAIRDKIETARLKSRRAPSSSRPLWVLVLITSLMAIVVLTQGFLFNLFYIFQLERKVFPSMWFLADLCIVCVFLGTLSVAHQDLKKQSSGIMEEVGISIKHKYVWHPGRLPLSYISWLFYSIIVVSKIFLMIHLDLVHNTNLRIGTASVQVAVGLSGLVYMLLIEGHVWAPRGTVRYMTVTLACADTAIEVLDSANLLSFVYSYKSYTQTTPVMLATPVTEIIVMVCVFTFFLPTMDLYQLTMTDFQMELMGGPLTTFHDILHILLIDCPNISVRIYMWTLNDYYTSIYFMRNVLNLFILIRRVIPDLADLVFMCRYIQRKPRISTPSDYIREFQREHDLEEEEKEIEHTLKTIQLAVEVESRTKSNSGPAVRQVFSAESSKSKPVDSDPGPSPS